MVQFDNLTVFDSREIAAGMHTCVFATSSNDTVFIETNDFFKYELIQTYEKIHKVDFKLSEKNVICYETEENTFFMKKLNTRVLSDDESKESYWLENEVSVSEGMTYVDMENFVRHNAKTKIGTAFADSLLMVIDFTNNYHHGYTILDFHSDQILFDENDNCYILDILE